MATICCASDVDDASQWPGAQPRMSAADESIERMIASTINAPPPMQCSQLPCMPPAPIAPPDIPQPVSLERMLARCKQQHRRWQFHPVLVSLATLQTPGSVAPAANDARVDLGQKRCWQTCLHRETLAAPFGAMHGLCFQVVSEMMNKGPLTQGQK